MKKLLIIVILLSSCASLPKSLFYAPILTTKIELLGCNGQIFETHEINNFHRNDNSVQWNCKHGIMIYRGNYRVIKH